MDSPLSMRRPYFTEDDGLASVSGFCNKANNNNNYVNNNNVAPPVTMMMRRRNSLRNMNSLASPTPSSSTIYSPRSGRIYHESRFEENPPLPHFLQSCFLCKKQLGGNRDIFMYRGDTPFCSEECRQEQIEIDEAKEKNWNFKAIRSKKEASKTTSSSSSSPFRAGTVAAA